jgi:hypothetical protein
MKIKRKDFSLAQTWVCEFIPHNMQGARAGAVLEMTTGAQLKVEEPKAKNSLLSCFAACALTQSEVRRQNSTFSSCFAARALRRGVMYFLFILFNQQSTIIKNK